MIAEDFKKEGFEIWCLPEDEYSSLWAIKSINENRLDVYRARKI